MKWFSGLILDMNRAWPEWGHTWIGTVGHESGWHGKGQTWIGPLKYVKYMTDMNGVRHEKVRTWIGPFGHEWGQTWIGPDMNRSDMNRWTWIGSTWIGRAWMGIIPNITSNYCHKVLVQQNLRVLSSMYFQGSTRRPSTPIRPLVSQQEALSYYYLQCQQWYCRCYYGEDYSPCKNSNVSESSYAASAV